MTNEEILKRLAEIEGIDLGDFQLKTYSDTTISIVWNPLTRWQDLGPLIEKYEPTMMKIAAEGVPGTDHFVEVDYWSVHIKGPDVKRESLPHAICLAIIEANQ